MTARTFPSLNRAYNTVFQTDRLTLGLVVPLEAYDVHAQPTMASHIERIQYAESLGFSAVWLRDIPFRVPSFGDVGHMFDPFVYLGALAVATHNIALGVASIILPLRHPAHVAKAAASVDVLSEGRLLLGVASGDRPEEYPALNMTYEDRGVRFREHFNYLRAVCNPNPTFSNAYGTLPGTLDMVPKPTHSTIPMLITGGSQQSPNWTAQHGDGWMTYPRAPQAQGRVIADFRNRVAELGEPDKPVMQSLYIDLLDNPNAPAKPIHLGFQSGSVYLREYLKQAQRQGVNHIALNLRFNKANIEHTLKHLADELLPEFTH